MEHIADHGEEIMSKLPDMSREQEAEFWKTHDSTDFLENYEAVTLNHALEQSGWEGEPLSEQNWRHAVSQKVETLPWQKVIADVQPFVMRPQELSLLTKENLLGSLRYCVVTACSRAA